MDVGVRTRSCASCARNGANGLVMRNPKTTVCANMELHNMDSCYTEFSGSFRKSKRFYSQCNIWNSLYIVMLLLTLTTNVCFGFNLDVANKIVFQSGTSDSYFGYTVAMLNRDTSKW